MLFVRLSIISKKIKSALEEGATIGISIMFWVPVFNALVVIKARPVVPYFMYVMILSTKVVVLCFHDSTNIVFTTLCNVEKLNLELKI